jgi:ubiquinone/menaquinone biosynthesis C-methylase UbiE
MGRSPWLNAVSGKLLSRLLARPAETVYLPEGSAEGGRRPGLTLDDSAFLETIRSYDVSAQEYADRFADADLRALYQRFLTLVPPGDEPVLDAGCGSGRDCELFILSGLRMIGADISAGLLKLAAQRTNAKLAQCDLRLLPFEEQCFRAVWSCASLVHLGHQDAENAVREFCRVLIPGGTLFLAVRHGAGQEWRSDSKGGRRWFQLYERRTLEEMVTLSGFGIVESEVAEGSVVGQWVNIFAKKA